MSEPYNQAETRVFHSLRKQTRSVILMGGIDNAPAQKRDPGSIERTRVGMGAFGTNATIVSRET